MLCAASTVFAQAPASPSAPAQTPPHPTSPVTTAPVPTPIPAGTTPEDPAYGVPPPSQQQPQTPTPAAPTAQPKGPPVVVPAAPTAQAPFQGFPAYAPVEQKPGLDWMGSTYIPVDSWMYPALTRLYEMGFLDTMYLGMRP